MLEIFAFIQKYLPIEAFIPLFFLIVALFYKYVYTPWDMRIKKMENYLDNIDDKVKKNDFATVNNQLAVINEVLENLVNSKAQ